MQNDKTINQKMIESVYEVVKDSTSTIMLSQGSDDCRYEYQEEKIFLNESDADEYAKVTIEKDDIKSEYESELYVDEVVIEDLDVEKKKISIDDLADHDLSMILLRNKNLEVKEVTVTKKVLVEKQVDTSVSDDNVQEAVNVQ